jgi:protein-S-isoprenylcysteine O-methyltransferase Ste14
MAMPTLSPGPRPRSAVSDGVGYVGLAGLLCWAATAFATGMRGPLAALAALFACGVPMILWTLLVDKAHRNPSTGIDWDRPPRPLSETLDTSIVKLVGLWSVWGIIAGLYCIGRWYWRDPYLFSMQLFAVAAVPMVLLSIPYILWLDRRLKDPKDGAWHFGQFVIGRTQLADRALIHDFLRAWAIKGFFLAFMLAILPGNWERAVGADLGWIMASPANLALWLIMVMFMIDVAMASVGYICTLKVLDAHIRSANPYAAGWTAALICYPPFILMNGALDYHPNTAGPDGWVQWFGEWPWLLALNGGLLVLLAGFYAWATVAFGLRFSNLTHRGILTHGPYALTKHPAYLSKNLFWWLAVWPIFATTGSSVDIIRNCALLAIVSGVYYWRARTEERHLGADPDYRAYAVWMEQHGPVPRFIRWLSGAPSPRPAPAD